MARKRLGVVGAGAAGVAAALELSKSGAEVVVLEASPRLGGRIQTFTDWGAPIDLGAAWLHGYPENPLADSFPADQLVFTDFSKPYEYQADGQPLSDTFVKFRNRHQLGMLGLATELAETHDWQISLAEALQRLPPNPAPRLSHVSLGKQRASQSFIEDLSLLPAQRADRDRPSRDPKLGDYWVRGGYQPWLEGLLSGANLDIHRGWEVKRIVQNDMGVTVRSHNGEEIHFEALVVSLPLGILRTGQVQFEPPLPPEKNEAIHSLGIGSQNKCLLRFSEVFWPHERDCLFFMNHFSEAEKAAWEPGESHNAMTVFIDVSRLTGQSVLVCLARDDEARYWEQIDDHKIVTQLLKPLRTAFGEKFREPIGHEITRWGQGWAQGAFSYLPWPQSAQLFQNLARPQGRLFFAGEATAGQHCGTVHGAYLSGQRAASECLRALA